MICKGTVRKKKTSYSQGDYICKTPSDKGLVYQMGKKLLKINNKKKKQLENRPKI